MPWRYWNKAADKTPNKNTDKNPVPTTAAPVAPVTLYFKCYDHLIFDGWEDLFLACVKTAATKSRFNPTVYAKESTDDFFDNNDLVKIGVHPLGLFETYVTSDDLQKMLEMNVDKPIEKDTVPYPTDPAVDEGLNVPSKVKITDDKINKPEDAESIPQPKPGANTIGEENPPAKNDTVTDISTNKLAAARNRERKPGQDDAMGLSAFEVSGALSPPSQC
ncbi:hypothetical protein SISNIDRAFT_125486 [Sistotremastrum niveocremeum HHB9708]|uniref:Uncharacterized protein n=1 Tax=Sistotremastrum niveocremeum HHB9708 TaxID=1314777 RepID=A0A164TAZ8_9AGAM|nr:hypothetical protein SISNIDRAFT_125486 [Sistotremastrum niveocremeum HHB9708]